MTLDNLIEIGKTHMGDFYTSKEKKGCGCVCNEEERQVWIQAYLIIQ